MSIFVLILRRFAAPDRPDDSKRINVNDSERSDKVPFPREGIQGRGNVDNFHTPAPPSVPLQIDQTIVNE